MNIIYPINGRNERMGSLFSTPKHLLQYHGKPLILHSIDNIKQRFPESNIIIITNNAYYSKLRNLVDSSVQIVLASNTNSQVETLQLISNTLSGPTMFIDCDIIPIHITSFDLNYTTVFTFLNNTKLLNYSNYKSNSANTIIQCNEKQKLYKHAGAGIYYFSDINVFNKYSDKCKSVSECINLMVLDNIKCKLNIDSDIKRFGTLQDIYVDTFSFRKLNQKDLSTGFTSNKVFKKKNTVIKIGKLVTLENEWYNSYKNKAQIPNVISCQDDTLILEYIHRNSDFNLDDILELVHTYKEYDKLNDLSFNSYISNIEKHLNTNANITNGNKLLHKLVKLNVSSTFCHGDLSVMNMIPTLNGIKLIDPLYSKYNFGSYEIDLAKLCFSFKFYKNDSSSFNYIKSVLNIPYIDILIAAEAVRVATYKSEYSFIAENLINEL